MQWPFFVGGLGLAILLALVESMRFEPTNDSEFELERRASEADTHAAHELKRRKLLPLLVALQKIKSIILSVAIVGVLALLESLWLGLVSAFVLLLAAQIVAAQGWLERPANKLRRMLEPHLVTIARTVRFVWQWWAPRRSHASTAAYASKAEFEQLLANDQNVLSDAEKARLLGALTFSHTTIAQLMVPRPQIVTVDANETVGPLLLDRLHKAGHNIFPVVRKNLDNIQGWLYMADLVPLDPDLKQVDEAVRPTVHYLPTRAHLGAVLAASLQTGRQIFIVVSDDGETKGLITLSDVLTHLLGAPLAKDSPVKTKP